MSIYVLEDQKKTWGVFTDRVLLFSAYSTLLEVGQHGMRVREFRPNTGLVLKEWSDNKTILKEFSIVPQQIAKDESMVKTDAIPKAAKRQVERVLDQYRTFSENLALFKRLDTTEKQDLPELLRPHFEIFTDIVRLDVPDSEAFGYFVDRTNLSSQED